MPGYDAFRGDAAMAERDAQGKWLKGISPYPGGRPKGRGLRAEIERKLAEVPAGSNETRMERIAQVLVEKCEEGDMRALELLLKRAWPERLSVQSEGPLVVLKDYTGGFAQADAGPAPDAPLLVEADNAPEAAPVEPEPERATWTVRAPRDEDREPTAIL